MTSETRVQHTPGPWQYVLDQVRGVWTIMDYDARMYADVRPRGNRDSAEVEANARLIAAAPDLLAALEALVNEVLDRDELDDDDDMNAMTQRAIMVMRRARGEE